MKGVVQIFYHPLIHVNNSGNAGWARFTSLDMIELEQSSYIFVLHLEHKKGQGLCVVVKTTAHLRLIKLMVEI